MTRTEATRSVERRAWGVRTKHGIRHTLADPRDGGKDQRPITYHRHFIPAEPERAAAPKNAMKEYVECRSPRRSAALKA
jgi:hypothetical protein